MAAVLPSLLADVPRSTASPSAGSKAWLVVLVVVLVIGLALTVVVLVRNRRAVPGAGASGGPAIAPTSAADGPAGPAGQGGVEHPDPGDGERPDPGEGEQQ